MVVPLALFLDEPTTGLDATTAQQIMAKLQILVKKYNLVMLTVLHQPRPSIVRMLDQVDLFVPALPNVSHVTKIVVSS